MALNIKNAEAERLARRLSELTGESITEVVLNGLRERLLRVEGRPSPANVLEELAAIRQRCSALPILDARSPDEILGYDDRGLPGGASGD
jgi:antitoxin VapB